MVSGARRRRRLKSEQKSGFWDEDKSAVEKRRYFKKISSNLVSGEKVCKGVVVLRNEQQIDRAYDCLYKAANRSSRGKFMNLGVRVRLTFPKAVATTKVMTAMWADRSCLSTADQCGIVLTRE